MKYIYIAKSLYEEEPKERSIGFFEQEESAIEAAKKQGIKGEGDGKVVKVALFTTFEEYANTQKSQIVKRALSKLTPEEKKAYEEKIKKELYEKLVSGELNK